ncbi:MAG: hypothetical protein C4308_11210 [Chitinophagaceae bacterium]
MKKNFLYYTFIAAANIVLLIACEKDKKYIARFKPIEQNAYLKVVHVSPNFRAIQAYPDSFDLYVGSYKVNGPLITYNTFFPVATPNTNTYAAIPAGAQQIRFSLRGVNTIDSLTIISLQKVLIPGNYYTLFITDSLQTLQEPTKIWTVDNIVKPDTGTYSVRFAHMILNDTAGKKVDVFSYRKATNIFSAISPGTVTDFINLPYYYSPTLDTLSVRRTGTGQELFRLNGVSFTNNQRVYTILYRGAPNLTTGTKARGLVVYNNR